MDPRHLLNLRPDQAPAPDPQAPSEINLASPQGASSVTPESTPTPSGWNEGHGALGVSAHDFSYSPDLSPEVAEDERAAWERLRGEQPEPTPPPEPAPHPEPLRSELPIPPIAPTAPVLAQPAIGPRVGFVPLGGSSEPPAPPAMETTWSEPAPRRLPISMGWIIFLSLLIGGFAGYGAVKSRVLGEQMKANLEALETRVQTEVREITHTVTEVKETVTTLESTIPIPGPAGEKGEAGATGARGATGLTGTSGDPCSACVFLQSTYPGVVQQGHLNISGNGRLGGQLDIGSGLVGTTFQVAGNVGIGTAPSGDPAKKLVLYSTTTGGTQLQLQNADTGGQTWTIVSTGSGNSGGAGHLQFIDGTSRRLVIQGDGNVGIGTTSPNNLLVLERNSGLDPKLKINTTNAALKPQIGFSRSDVQKGLIYLDTSDKFHLAIGNADDALTIDQTGSALFKNGTNSTTAFQIQNSSNVSLFTANTSSGQILLPNATASGTGLVLGGDMVLYRTISPSTGIRTDGGFHVGNELNLFGTSLLWKGAQSNYWAAPSVSHQFLTSSGSLGPVTAGSATLRSDSATIFQIQNSASANLFTADTSNSKITIDKANVNLTGIAAPGTPSLGPGSNQGGNFSGTFGGPIYYYRITALTTTGESVPSPESSFKTENFTGVASPSSAPAAAINPTAGLLNGTYRYKVTFSTVNGETAESSSFSTASPISQQVDLSSIPIGSAGVISRKIYRTFAGETTNYRFVATISDNTTTTYTDNISDGSLGNVVCGYGCSSIKPTTNTNNISVTFSPVSGATSYRIYRGTSPGGQTSYQAASSSPFTDTGAAGTSGTPPAASTIERLAIGTSTPSANLHVAGNALFQNAADSSSALRVNNQAGTSLLTINTNSKRGALGGTPGSSGLVVATDSLFQNTVTLSNGLAPSALSATTAITQTTVQILNKPYSSLSPSIAIGPDGLPILSYYGWQIGGLAVTKCNDVTCTSKTTVDLDNRAGTSAFYTTIAIAGDGLPIIAYQESNNQSPFWGLRVAKCGDLSCTPDTTTITTVEGGAVGAFASMVISTDGLAFIGHKDSATNDLKAYKCTNATCTSGTSTTLDTAGNVGDYTSVALGSDGYPVIAYRHTTDGLKVYKCTNAACTAGGAVIVGPGGLGTTVTIAADGLPIISHSDSGSLKVYKCSSQSCSSGSSTTMGSSSDNTYIKIGADGYPLVGYSDSGYKIIKCTSVSCSTSTAPTLIDASANIQRTNFTFGPDGLPLSMYHLSATGLHLLRCANTACSSTSGTITAGTPLNASSGSFSQAYIGSIRTNDAQNPFTLATNNIDRLKVDGSGNLSVLATSSLFKPSADSTTAFQIQNGTGTALLIADTQNMTITLGSASSTPVILVLGSKNTSGDPACTDGGVYYNSSQTNGKQAKVCIGGSWTAAGVPRVTALPTTPSDGDEVYYEVDATNGVYWHFRYRAASASAYKWEYLGGTRAFSQVDAVETTASVTYVALTTAGPSITLPLAGDYIVEIGSSGSNNTAGNGNIMSYDIGATGAVDADMTLTVNGSAAPSAYHTVSRTNRKAGLTVVTLTAKYRASGGGTAEYRNRWMAVTPVRVQ